MNPVLSARRASTPGAAAPRTALGLGAALVAIALSVGSSGSASAAQLPLGTTPTTPATPTAPPSPTRSAPAAHAAANPSLAVQTAAHDHAMGSTIRAFQGSTTVTPKSSTSTPRTSSTTSTSTSPSASGALTPSATPNLASTSASLPPGVQGLDVSGWQGNVDWASVASNGGKFAYVKATEGGYVSNNYFAQQYTGSYNAGLIRGAYHFALPNKSSGAAQAQFFVAHGGGWSADGKTLPPLLDIEYDPYTSTDGTTGWCYGLSPSQMVTWINDFSSTVASLTKRPPVIYTTTGWWQKCTGNATGFSDNPLHIAAYPTNISYGAGTLPASWTYYSIWQWSDTGVFPGDQDVFNGSYSQLQTFAGVPPTTTPPPPPPAPKPSITSPADLLGIDSSGTLWGYPATGSGGYGTRYSLGSGWGQTKTAFVVDFNSDGILDVLAQRDDGTLQLYTGLAAGGITWAAQVGLGWSGFQLAPSSWRTSDRYPGIVARDPQGRLWYYPNSSGASLDGTRTAIGVGWQNFSINVMDVDGDGKMDVLADRTDGSLLLYRSDGSGRFLTESRPVVGTSYGSVTSLVPILGFTGSGSRGVLSRDASGTLQYASTGSLDSRQTVGPGWTGWTIFGSQDLVNQPSIRSTSDVVSLDSAGTAWRYPATFAPGLAPAVQIATGLPQPVWASAVDWDQDGVKDLLFQTTSGQLVLRRGLPSGGFEQPVVVGDSGWTGVRVSVGMWRTADGYPGLLAVMPSGQLRYYANTTGGQLTGSGVAIGTGWTGIDVLLADWNGDGTTDVLAKRPSGQLSMFPGDGNGGFSSMQGTTVGTGWQALDSIAVTSNFGGAGEQGLLGRQSDGTLRYYPISGHSSWGSPVSVPTDLSGQLVLR